MTLGEKLVRINQLTVSKTHEYHLRQEALTNGTVRQNIADVQAFFDSVKDSAIKSIEKGFIPKARRVQYWGEGRVIAETYGTSSWERLSKKDQIPLSHPYYFLWKDFTDWATTEGLKAYFVHGHDGAGVAEWYDLYIAVA